MKLETITGTGNARHRMPVRAHTEPTTFPWTVTGCMSPYPTVVIVTIAHQNASGILLKYVDFPVFESVFSAK